MADKPEDEEDHEDQIDHEDHLGHINKKMILAKDDDKPDPKPLTGVAPFVADETPADMMASEEWRQWHHVLHGLHAERFSAWKAAPMQKDDLPITTGAIQVLAFILQSPEDFDRWLLRENAQDGLYYRKICQTLRDKSACEYMMFHCHKSGKPRLKDGERKRKQRENKSKKLGFTCTSKIVARKHLKDSHTSWRKVQGRTDGQGFPLDNERVPVKAGQVSVIYYYTHAHQISESDIRETPISAHTRRLIKVWRALGLSVDEIHDNLLAARSDDAITAQSVGVTIPTTREAHINKRDLRNILVAANMYKRDAPRNDDVITDMDLRAGDLLITELKDKYGSGEAPLPPPFWGTQLLEQDARAARIMIELYGHLMEASNHMEDLANSTPADKADLFLSYKQKIDVIRATTLMTTCKRLLFPNLGGAAAANVMENPEENAGLGMSAASFMASDGKSKHGNISQHYVV